MNKIVALIPARYGSTRFPGKLMEDLGGKPVIVQTYLAATNTQLFDEVYVVTDSRQIANAVIQHGGKAIFREKEYPTGSDRIADVLDELPNADIIINVQGDEPFINKEPLQQLIALFEDDTVQVGSLMHVIDQQNVIHNPNNVKVVVNHNNRALLFSRAAIPHAFNPEVTPVYYKHIGVYGFRRAALKSFPLLPIGPLEKAEKLENLRFIENNIVLKMAITKWYSIGIDTTQDLTEARNRLIQWDNLLDFS